MPPSASSFSLIFHPPTQKCQTDARFSWISRKALEFPTTALQPAEQAGIARLRQAQAELTEGYTAARRGCAGARRDRTGRERRRAATDYAATNAGGERAGFCEANTRREGRAVRGAPMAAAGSLRGC